MKRYSMEVAEAKMPQGLHAVAQSVDPNEKAYLLMERNISTKDSRGVHRFQVIYVNRNDELASFVRDLGEVTDDVGAFVIPSGASNKMIDWLYTVEELADMANAMREETGLKEILDRRKEESTLIKDAMELAEARELIKKNKTQFGASGSAPLVQRTGYHRKV